MGLFDKLKKGLQKTKDLLRTDVRDLLKAGEILTEDILQSVFYARLIATDMGVVSATAIIDDVRQQHLGRTIDLDNIWATIRAKFKSLLKGGQDHLWDANNPLSPLNFAPQ